VGNLPEAGQAEAGPANDERQFGSLHPKKVL
jgi:hypothetical protein